MIEFDEVSFSYSTRRVFEAINFSVGWSERIAILGGSGEGKTTILRLTMGLVRPDSGRIRIDGQDIAGLSEDELREVRKKFSIVFQEGALFDSLNVKENVAFCLREYTKMPEEEIERRVRDLLRMVDLEGAMELMPDELSGGMHRRVAIVRSLAAFNPKMFLYDEPTAGLDPVNADTICRVIDSLSKEGKGFIIVTHKIYDALRAAERVMFLRQGRIIFDGPKSRFVNSRIPEVRLFLSELKLPGKGACTSGGEDV
jgi:phospholipid/cholesterol/gamma-HCH transport system ATP-binding protein